jgi:hypothetical protein
MNLVFWNKEEVGLREGIKLIDVKIRETREGDTSRIPGPFECSCPMLSINVVFEKAKPWS